VNSNIKQTDRQTDLQRSATSRGALSLKVCDKINAVGGRRVCLAEQSTARSLCPSWTEPRWHGHSSTAVCRRLSHTTPTRRRRRQLATDRRLQSQV